MARVIWSVMSSLDGHSAAPGEGFETIDWFRADEEWLDYSVELLDAADTILFGRTTFDGMESYWPTAAPRRPGQVPAMPTRGSMSARLRTDDGRAGARCQSRKRCSNRPARRDPATAGPQKVNRRKTRTPAQALDTGSPSEVSARMRVTS